LTEHRSRGDNASSLQDDSETPANASGMANVMAKILCKNINSSKSVILAKCKTDRELSRSKRAERSSDSVEIEQVKELQPAKVQKNLVLKVCAKSYLGFKSFFGSSGCNQQLLWSGWTVMLVLCCTF